jgi:hypothetical protein
LRFNLLLFLTVASFQIQTSAINKTTTYSLCSKKSPDKDLTIIVAMETPSENEVLEHLLEMRKSSSLEKIAEEFVKRIANDRIKYTEFDADHSFAAS